MDDLTSRRSVCRNVQSSEGEEEEDYLSNLPDELLLRILSLLPTLVSIRTSVLSRRWRHLWTSVPIIDFSYHHLKPSTIYRFFASRGVESVSRLRLSGLINIHDRRITVYKLIAYAKSHDARHVTLRRFFFEYCSESVFELLFDWPSLESLHMQVAGVTNLTLFEFSEFRLSNLKTLSLALGQNKISNEIIAKLLSACPVLEGLRLKADHHQAWQEESIRIQVPNLLRLILFPAPSKLQINCQRLEYLRLKADVKLTHFDVEAPSLSSVRLHGLWRFGTLAQTVCNVTTVALTVSHNDPVFLKKYKVMVRRFPIFHKLLELKIKMYVADQFSLDVVFDLLRCTPNLQSLVLTEFKKPPRDEDLGEWESSSSRIKKPLKHLEKVSVNISSERNRMMFLKTLSEVVQEWDRVVVTY